MSPHAETTRPPAHIPTLRSGELDPQRFAHSTCFEAGYLVSKNAGWRNRRPIVDKAACTGCLQCYLYCPDGTIYKAAAFRGTQSAAAGEGSRTEVRHASASGLNSSATEALACTLSSGVLKAPRHPSAF